MIRQTRLGNGLTVLTDPMPDAEAVAIGVWIGCGARHEAHDINGAAHLLEHMAFKGTRRRSARMIAEEIETVGGQINAYTSRESTAYYAKVLRQDTGLALDILADILQHSVLDPEELARERAVILQEISQVNDTPDDVIFDHFQEAAFPAQPIGRPVLGRAPVVRGMDRARLMDYMRRHYTGSRMMLVAAGAVDHDWLAEAAEAALGGLPGDAFDETDIAQYQGGEYREARDLEQVHLLVGFPGVGNLHDDHYAQSVLSTALGGGMSSRLFQEIRENRGLAYSIFSFASTYSDTGLFGVYAGTSPEDARTLLSLLRDEIRDAAESLSEDEVDRARAQFRAGVLMARESSTARCEQLAHTMLVHGRPVPLDEVLARIDAVDVTATRRVLGTMLERTPTLALMGPPQVVDTLASVAPGLELTAPAVAPAAGRRARVMAGE